ncbi:MAG: xanthine dehydrogenase family protein molybdopterin-binding subunit [Pseudomonadota bacterium]
MDTPPPSRTAGAIGAALPNQRWTRLLRGRGRFVSSHIAPNCLHAVIVRAEEASGTLDAIDTATAVTMPGVIAIFRAADFDDICASWRATHAFFADAKVPAEFVLARSRVHYVGEPLAIVVAQTQAQALAAAEQVTVTLTPTLALTTPAAALSPNAPPIHDAFAGEDHPNRHLRLQSGARGAGNTEHHVSLTLARVAPQPMETRAVLADYDPVERRLTVHQSHQHPHQMQDIYARLLGLPEHHVRVVCNDVGGAFGMKQQLHTDEMAAVCAAVRLGRSVYFRATRSESLLADAQARDHRMDGTLVLDDATGRITGMSVRDVCGVGAFGQYPRTSFGEAGMAHRLFGAPYALDWLRVDTELAFQNRAPLGHYRGVGHPVACLLTEALMDKAARALGEDPIALRKRHLIDTTQGPLTTLGGIGVEHFRMAECLDALADRLSQHAAPPGDGRLRGTGVACLLEMIANGSRYYGEGGVHIAATETAVLRLEPSGVLRLAGGHTDQGQGADQTMAQIVADQLAVPVTDVAVVSGDSAACPYGGGAFGSRGTVVAGTAAYGAASEMRRRLIDIAALLHQTDPASLTLQGGALRKIDGSPLMTLKEVAETAHFKPHLLPAEHQSALTVVHRHVPPPDAMVAAAAFAAVVAIDPDTGVVEVDRVIVAHDCGTVINPAAVQAQLTGAIAQGFGQAVLEAVRIDDTGQPLTGSFMDYAMPRADNAPLVEVIHLPPLPGEGFSPRGVGETGTSGAPAAILNAINDALSQKGTAIAELPATSQLIWQTLQESGGRP